LGSLCDDPSQKLAIGDVTSIKKATADEGLRTGQERVEHYWRVTATLQGCCGYGPDVASASGDEHLDA
jgi:hypothetical protein